MAEEQEAANASREPARESAAPERKLVLATDMNAEPDKDGKRPRKRPPTVNGHVNIGMGVTVGLPSLDEQIVGFTPTLVKGPEGADPVDIVLAQFYGIYKLVSVKGGE